MPGSATVRPLGQSASSTSTIAPLLAGLFLKWPSFLLPLFNPRLISLDSASDRPLWRPAQMAEDSWEALILCCSNASKSRELLQTLRANCRRRPLGGIQCIYGWRLGRIGRKQEPGRQDTTDIPEITNWTGAVRGLFARPETRQISIRLSAADLVTANRIAAAKGLPYQTYIKSLLHEALENESSKLPR